MFLLSSQTWSLDVTLEKCHTLPIIINYTVFIISHVSTVLWYHSVPKLSFSPPNTQSPLVFHFFFLSVGFSHTPYMSLHMTHTTKITLSISPVDTTFVAVSFSSPSQTDIIHFFTDQTTPTTVSSLSFSLTHRHTRTTPTTKMWMENEILLYPNKKGLEGVIALTRTRPLIARALNQRAGQEGRTRCRPG